MTHPSDPTHPTHPTHPSSADSAGTAPYAELLGEAVRVLTSAARAGYDWAEFVSLACAGAAANIGGIEEILSVRSGSWEAAFVRQLLEGTVSPDETALWAHRTEPVDLTLNVEDVLADLGDDSFIQYDRDVAELEDRAEVAAVVVDADRYAWVYRRTDTGEWVSNDTTAPPWSLDQWRVGVVDEGIEPADLADLEDAIGRPDWAGVLLIPKYPGGLTDLGLAERAGDDTTQPIYDAIERLEAQRLGEQQTFGGQLADRLQTAARTVLPGLAVPVTVTVIVDAQGRGERSGPDPIWARLSDAVAFSTDGYPTVPGDLPGTPLDRLDLDSTADTDTDTGSAAE